VDEKELSFLNSEAKTYKHFQAHIIVTARVISFGGVVSVVNAGKVSKKFDFLSLTLSNQRALRAQTL